MALIFYAQAGSDSILKRYLELNGITRTTVMRNEMIGGWDLWAMSDHGDSTGLNEQNYPTKKEAVAMARIIEKRGIPYVATKPHG